MPPSNPNQSFELVRFIDAAATSALERRRIAGLSVAVAREGRVVHASGYGYADLEKGVWTSADTAYGIGSLTKGFTAAAVMRLAQRGAVTLDGNLVKYMPCPALRVPVTIRHLLNHTSGLKGEADFGMFLQAGSRGSLDRGSVLATLDDALFDSTPGEIWRYSNLGYVILGLLIEHVTGEAYANHIQRAVLEPAGLVNTWHGPRCVPGARLANGYTDRHGQFASVAMPSPEQTFSSGALYSTVLDLVAWQTALLQGLVVGTDGYEGMTTPDSLKDGTPLGYGYGCFVGSCGGHREVSHDGTSGGFSSQLACYPDDHLIVAVLTNSESHEAERIEKQITRHVLALEEPPTKNLIVTRGDLAPYEGTYLHKGLRIPVYIDSDSLMAQTPGQKVVRLVYQGDHTFVQDDDPAVRFEFTVHSDRADGFVVWRESKTLATVRRLP